MAAGVPSTQTISGVITGSGTLTKTGNGILALTGANNSSLDLSGSAAIQVNRGLLQINSDAALGVAPGTVVANNIILNDAGLSGSANFTLSSNRGILIGPNSGSGTGVLDATIAGAIMNYGGIIANNGAGTGNLMKTGLGTVALSGVNTYSGWGPLQKRGLSLFLTGRVMFSVRSFAEKNGSVPLSTAVPARQNPSVVRSRRSGPHPTF
jgi:hypothetical protein